LGRVLVQGHWGLFGYGELKEIICAVGFFGRKGIGV
jgi:hypothetical protein